MSTHGHSRHADAPTTAHEPQEATRFLHDPATRALLGVLAAGLLFWFGTHIGDALHRAFHGDTGAVLAFGATALLIPASLVALGAVADRWLDTRRQRASGSTRPRA